MLTAAIAIAIVVIAGFWIAGAHGQASPKPGSGGLLEGAVWRTRSSKLR